MPCLLQGTSQYQYIIKYMMSWREWKSLGVIAKVIAPAQWYAGMVVVPKSTRAVRICVDLIPLNENVLREPHPAPTVDETLAQLLGATIFSKVDANIGFWKIVLSEELQHYTTLISPIGHFRKLPFGITSAPELFQQSPTRSRWCLMSHE